MKNNSKEKRIFCAGTFDGIHPGHLKFLGWAKGWGGELWVVVARDESARKVRGHAPLFGEKERLELVGAIKIVDRVILGSKKSWFDSVKKVKPSVIVLGHDQKVDLRKLREFVESGGLEATIVRAPEFERSKFRSSRVRNERPGFHQKI